MNQSPSRPTAGTGYADFLTMILSERDRYFEDVVDGVGLGDKLRYAAATIMVLSFFYGAMAGAYSSGMQALASGLKFPFLFLATFAICFPAFFIVQVLVGSRLRLSQVTVLVLGALALTTLFLAAFVPITVFFLVTGANYHFLQLLHVAILLVSGGFGMYTLQRGLELVCERRGEYPKNAITIMRAWALIFAFVGIQMAWNLRPFLGDRDQEFQVFRDYEGNFYAAVLYSVTQLFEGDPEGDPDQPTASTIPLDRLLTDPADSTAADSESQPR